MTDQFKIGDLVTWASQAQGRNKVKTGKVVYILNGKARNWRDYPYAIVERLFPNHKKMFDGLSVPCNAEIGYLVEVLAEGKGKPKLYMPYPNKLRGL